MMKLIGNLIWFIFGGIFIAIEYLVSSLILFCTIIGIPFGLQTIKLASVALWPFGKNIVVKENSNGGLTVLMNIIWIIFGGLCICLSHLVIGMIFFITIIGIPFGKQHFKLAGLALTPFGRKII